MQPVNHDPTRLYLLHEMVLSTLEEALSADQVNPKAIELAMKFLKDNNIVIDLTGGVSKRDQLKARMSVIPRLSDEELKLG
jgi:hypothetical protein